MKSDDQDKLTPEQDLTLPSRPDLKAPTPTEHTIAARPQVSPSTKVEAQEKAEKPAEQAIQPSRPQAVTESDAHHADAPWTLQQFFNGEIDLDSELAKRFPNMPLMSTVHFRSLGSKSKRGVASLSTQDGAATVLVDADAVSREVQFSFTFGSMLTLRFRLDDLTDMDRGRWLELMHREQGGLAFLWGQARWQNDYLICISRKYFTNLYAFSPYNFEAAVRMTPDVTRKLLDWLETFWKPEPPAEDPPKLLTTW